MLTVQPLIIDVSIFSECWTPFGFRSGQALEFEASVSAALRGATVALTTL